MLDHADENATLSERIKKMFIIPRGERVATLLAFSWFYLTLCSYYIIRPVRTSLVLYDFGKDMLPLVYMGTGLATGVVVYIFNKFTRISRKKLIGFVILFFAANLGFWAEVAGEAQAVRDAGGTGLNWTSPVFYVWTDVFSIMAVTVFWIVVNDLFEVKSAKRTFGLIAAAGPSGGATGAWIVETYGKEWGAVNLVWLACAIFTLTFLLYLALEAVMKGRSAHGDFGGKTRDSDLRRLPAVIRQIASSRFLILLALLVCFERITPDFVDYIFQSTAKDAFASKELYQEFFAGFEKWRNIAVLIGTVFLTSPMLHFGGPRLALITVPLAITVFGLGYLLIPVLTVAVLLKGFEEGQRHAWFKAGKETLYTVTSKDVIYCVKGYIEMFLYRFSRAIAGFLLFVMTGVLSLGTAWVAVVMVPVAVAWMYTVHRLGQEYTRLEKQAQASDRL